MQTATIFFNQLTINKDIFNEKNLFIARNLTKKDENYRNKITNKIYKFHFLPAASTTIGYHVFGFCIA